MRILGFILFVIFYIIANRKKTEKKGKPAHRPAGGKPPVTPAAGARPAVTESRPQTARAPLSMEGRSLEGEDPCHEEMLRPARPSSVRYEPAGEADFRSAGEGEDPCHPSGPARADGTHVHEDAAEAEGPFAAEDWMRAVVLSEILTRPQDRRRAR